MSRARRGAMRRTDLARRARRALAGPTSQEAEGPIAGIHTGVVVLISGGAPRALAGVPESERRAA